MPLRLEISKPAELASVLAKSNHWSMLLIRFSQLLELRNTSETLLAVLVRNVDGIMRLQDIDFQRLVAVLVWLGQHPNSELYIRQLPVRGVDTKWISANRRLVTAFHTANTGNTNLGIATDPTLWRIRLLDEAMRLGSLSDISAPLDQLAKLDLAPARILIVENLMSLLTLPAMEETVAIFERGNSVSKLAQLPWLHDAAVYYWGDVDTHGLRILHTLRAAGVEVTSLLMDLPTLEQFRDLWAEEAAPFAGTLDLLTSDEAEALEYLRAHPGSRLEQERIDWSYVLDTLRAQGLLADRLE